MAFGVVAAACAASPAPPSEPPPGASALPGESPAIRTAAPAGLVASRPYGVHAPRGWDRSTPAPLLIWLHGLGGSGAQGVAFYGLEALSDARGFVLAFPDGTRNQGGKRFWNATDVCCDLERSGVDDVAYLSAVLDDLEATLPIDRARVYVGGSSNGGFMAHRLGCDLAPRLAGVVSLAGEVWKDPERCTPRAPVSVLCVHGDADTTVNPEGNPRMPGDRETIALWASRDGCSGVLPASGPTVDFEGNVPGAETEQREVSGCPAGVSVALWTVRGGGHMLAPAPGAMDAVWTWLAGRTRR